MSVEAAARLRGLYAITPEWEDRERLEAACEAALAGGARILQYRVKRAPPAIALSTARALAALCRAHGALFIVNDSIELALACLADGVHLGRDDENARAARIVFPAGIIGVSCYDDPALARKAASQGADYVAIGSVFASTTKPGAARPPLEAIGSAARESGLPVVAIGGITPDNAAMAIEAGARMVAVITSLFEAPDIAAQAARFSRLFQD